MAAGKEVSALMQDFIMERNSKLINLESVSGGAVLDTLSEFRYITKLRRGVLNNLKNGGKTLSIIYIIYLILFSSHSLGLSFLLKLQDSRGGLVCRK